jgi:hypothetical protein
VIVPLVSGDDDLGRMIEHLPFLTEEECRQVRTKIIELRPYWEQRHPLLPSFTLGTAAYLDAPKGEQLYREKAARSNPVLAEHFSWLYERLKRSLTERLGRPVAYHADQALPGFHLFLAHEAFRNIAPSIHADWQYRDLDWSWARTAGEPMSFTLAISLPRSGGGLNVWDLDAAELVSLPNEKKRRIFNDHQPTYIAYQLGELNVHFGLLIHQIAPPREVFEGDERFTLQGHGLLCDGVWQMYW